MSGDTGYKMWSRLYMSYFFRCLGFNLQIIFVFPGTVGLSGCCSKWVHMQSVREERNVYRCSLLWLVQYGNRGQCPSLCCRLHLKCDGTRTETRCHLSAKWRWASVQSTTDSRGARINGSKAGYTKFRGSVKRTDYPLHSPVSPSLLLLCVTVCHHISTGL
jgi:hypothetical protein